MIRISCYFSDFLACAKFSLDFFPISNNKMLLWDAFIFCILSENAREQRPLVDSILSRLGDDDSELRQFIEVFQDMELINTERLCAQYESFLKRTFPFTDTMTCERNRALFGERIAEYNALVVSRAYTQVSLSEVSNLLSLQPHDAELFFCKLINQGKIKAKMDKLGELVYFEPQHPSNYETWCKSTEESLAAIVKVGHVFAEAN